MVFITAKVFAENEIYTIKKKRQFCCLMDKN